MVVYVGILVDILWYYEKNKIIVFNWLENGYCVYNMEYLLELKFILVMKYVWFFFFEIKLMMEWLRSEFFVVCNMVLKELFVFKVVEIK